MKWDLGSFLVITVLFLGYALYNTFCSFSIVAVLGYTAVLAVLIAAYRDVIWDGWQLIKKHRNDLMFIKLDMLSPSVSNDDTTSFLKND